MKKALMLEEKFPEIPVDPVKLAEFIFSLRDTDSTPNNIGGNYSANAVIGLDNLVIKIDKPASTKIETDVKKLKLGKYSDLSSHVIKGPVEINDLSVWAMNNVNMEIPGYFKTGIKDSVEHYMYLIGLFHYHATKQIGNAEISIPKVHPSSSDCDYVAEIIVEGINQAYEKIKRCGTFNFSRLNLEENLGPARAILEYLRDAADTVIDGDFKVENTSNGYHFDNNCIRESVEVDDLMRFFVSLRLDEQQMTYYIDKYIHHRSKYDLEFAEDKNKQDRMYLLVPTLNLKESLRSAGVLGKRPVKLIAAQFEELLYRADEVYKKQRQQLV